MEATCKALDLDEVYVSGFYPFPIKYKSVASKGLKIFSPRNTYNVSDIAIKFNTSITAVREFVKTNFEFAKAHRTKIGNCYVYDTEFFEFMSKNYKPRKKRAVSKAKVSAKSTVKVTAKAETNINTTSETTVVENVVPMVSPQANIDRDLVMEMKAEIENLKKISEDFKKILGPIDELELRRLLKESENAEKSFIDKLMFWKKKDA